MFDKYQVKPSDVVDENTKLVIDLDSMLFKLAATSEKTEIEVFNKSTNDSFGVFKNRTTFFGRSKNKVGANCILNDINIERETKGLEPFSLDDFSVKDIQTPIVGFSLLLKNMDDWVNAVAEPLSISADNIVFLMGDSGSFRDNIKLPKRYKDNRKTSLKPVMLKELRNMVASNTNPVMHDSLEADDVLNMYQFKGYMDYLKTGKASYIVSTIDKDAYGTSGFITNYDKADGQFKDNSLYLLPQANTDLGDLKLRNGIVKGCGLKWFICQAMLLGDSGDNYFTYQYFPELKGAYGHKQCYVDLAEIENPVQLLEYARDKWKEWFPSGVVEYTDWCGDAQSMPWQAFAELVFECAYMKRSYNDTMTLHKLYDNFGVDLYG